MSIILHLFISRLTSGRYDIHFGKNTTESLNAFVRINTIKRACVHCTCYYAYRGGLWWYTSLSGQIKFLLTLCQTSKSYKFHIKVYTWACACVLVSCTLFKGRWKDMKGGEVKTILRTSLGESHTIWSTHTKDRWSVKQELVTIWTSSSTVKHTKQRYSYESVCACYLTRIPSIFSLSLTPLVAEFVRTSFFFCSCSTNFSLWL